MQHLLDVCSAAASANDRYRIFFSIQPLSPEANWEILPPTLINGFYCRRSKALARWIRIRLYTWYDGMTRGAVQGNINNFYTKVQGVRSPRRLFFVDWDLVVSAIAAKVICPFCLLPTCPNRMRQTKQYLGKKPTKPRSTWWSTTLCLWVDAKDPEQHFIYLKSI